MNKQSSPLSFLVLGKGDLFSRLYYHTHFIVFLDDFPILVDCPDPLPKALYEASRKAKIAIGLDDINHIILTHLHGDHSNGLESLGFYNYYIRKHKPVIYTIPEVRDAIWENKLKASMGHKTNSVFEEVGNLQLSDYFRVKILEPGKTHTIRGMKIAIRHTNHFIPCFGFKISYKGRSLGYSSDTSFDREHIQFLSDCDLFLHETNKGGHTPYEKLLDLPREIKQKMMLVHIPDTFDIGKSEIPVAQEGRLYNV
jgi:ribonuclease BN (tRNA processing enzyme)